MFGREESPDNTEHHASEREDVREGIVTEKRMTASFWGKGEKAG